MKKELELYIHIPFCVQKCAYCDFLSAPASHEQKRAYVDALIQEIKNSTGYDMYHVISIFFGGGTPSLLPGDWIGEIMTALRERFDILKDAEITIEANPGTVDKEKLSRYRRAGINRISFGCQSADNAELKKLGRIHTWEDFLESYSLARACGFENINVDLMSGLPEQSVDSWKSTLQKVIDLGPEHISAYSLIVEEGTPFYDMEEELKLPDEESERQMYEWTGRMLQENGYEQYEISNYAKAGKECRHNMGYWIGREYLGLGLGSSSLIDKYRFSNRDNLREYMEMSDDPKRLYGEIQELTKENQMEEFMILGLRMTWGISEKEFGKRFDIGIDEVYGDIINKYCEFGYLNRADDRICFTRKGISVSNRILAEFLL